MKKVAGGLLVVLALAGGACGGVDKEGTADELIKSIEDSGLELDADQETCVRETITSRSEDELKTLDSMLEQNVSDDPMVADFMSEVMDCALGG